jgi:ribosomal protein S10
MQFKNKIQISITSSTQSRIDYLHSYLLFNLTQNKILNLKLYYSFLPIKIKKFTVLKSPHVFKTARTQLEIQNLKKIIVITNVKQIKHLQTINKILYNIIKNLPTLIKLQIKYSKLLFI